MLWKCADVPRNSPTLHTCREGDHLFQCKFHPSEQFYMHKNTSASVFIVWELKELTGYCQLLKKGSESALEVRRCSTKFSHLAPMSTGISPDPWLVYIPLNRSTCIRTFKKVCVDVGRISWYVSALSTHFQTSETGHYAFSCLVRLSHDLQTFLNVPMHVDLFIGISTSQGSGDIFVRMCGSWENFVVRQRSFDAFSNKWNSALCLFMPCAPLTKPADFFKCSNACRPIQWDVN